MPRCKTVIPESVFTRNQSVFINRNNLTLLMFYSQSLSLNMIDYLVDVDVDVSAD